MARPQASQRSRSKLPFNYSGNISVTWTTEGAFPDKYGVSFQLLRQVNNLSDKTAGIFWRRGPASPEIVMLVDRVIGYWNWDLRKMYGDDPVPRLTHVLLAEFCHWGLETLSEEKTHPEKVLMNVVDWVTN